MTGPDAEWWDLGGGSGVTVGRLLDSVDARPAAWDEIESRLVVEDECWCPAGYAVLPELAALARRDDHRDRALRLAATIVRSLHRCDEFDDLARAASDHVAALRGTARARLAAGPDFLERLRDAVALAGYTFWAAIDMDFTDEHYHVGCPHCATRLAVVIGDYGHYSAVRDFHDGDIHRVPLLPADPRDLTGIGRWMHAAAVAAGEPVIADGLTYLFGRAGCGACGSVFPVSDWFEAENGPSQPIDPVVPRTDRSA
ncbi:hypothetical protein GCM10009557_49000 [Virgisporangium ochraceum]